MQLQSSRVRLVEASPHDLVSPSDEARCVPRESRFQRMYGPHVFRQTAGVCSRIMRNRARCTCTRDQLHSDLRNILYSGMCSQSSVCRHFLTCQQVANISSCAARCQLSVSWSCRSTRSIEKMKHSVDENEKAARPSSRLMGCCTCHVEKRLQDLQILQMHRVTCISKTESVEYWRRLPTFFQRF